jgi:hypothetical protein
MTLKELIMTTKLSVRGLAFAAAIAFGCWLPTGALAQAQKALTNPNPSPAAIAVAKELLALKGGVEMFNGMVNGVIESAKNTFLPTNPNLAKPLGEVTAQLRTEYEPKKTEVYNEVARAYAMHFSEAEMKELVTFYKSPLGKKVLTEEPLAVEDAFKKAQDWSIAFSDQVLARFRTEMKKKGHDL